MKTPILTIDAATALTGVSKKVRGRQCWLIEDHHLQSSQQESTHEHGLLSIV